MHASHLALSFSSLFFISRRSKVCVITSNRFHRAGGEEKGRKGKAKCVAWSAVDVEEGSKRGSGAMLWLHADYVDTFSDGDLGWIALVGLEGGIRVLMWYSRR